MKNNHPSKFNIFGTGWKKKWCITPVKYRYTGGESGETNIISWHVWSLLVIFDRHFLHFIKLSHLFMSVRFCKFGYFVSHTVEQKWWTFSLIWSCREARFEINGEGSLMWGKQDSMEINRECHDMYHFGYNSMWSVSKELFCE